MSFIVATMKLLHNEPPQITMSNFFIMKLIVPPVQQGGRGCVWGARLRWEVHIQSWPTMKKTGIWGPYKFLSSESRDYLVEIR